MSSCVFRPLARRRRPIAAIVAALGCGLAAGCNESPSQPAQTRGQRAVMNARSSADTFRYAAGLLNSNDGLEAAEAAARESQSADEAARRLLFSQMPSAVVDQLNRWLGSQKLAGDWRPDPLLETLPEGLRELPAVKALREPKFSEPEAAALREAVWLRDISNRVCGEANDELEKASRLFDWTVRNIQLDPPATQEQLDKLAKAPCLPWHLLAIGHGEAQERAWLFMLLARQQAMDVVGLELAGERPRRLAGLLVKDQIYLFDPELGLPLPGPTPGSVATLSQIADDDALLRQLDLDAEPPYPLRAADAAQAKAYIEASPLYLERRTALIESRLTGDEKVVLSLDASALAKRLKACAHIGEVELWPLPYERLKALTERRSPGVQQLSKEFQLLMAVYEHVVKKKSEPTMALWRGRVQHLLGRFTGDTGANYFYQLTRIADAEIDERIAKDGGPREGEPPEIAQQRRQLVELWANQRRDVKHSASYWLGLVAYERENYATAIDYFEKRTLEAAPEGRWTPGALYNMGRAYEAIGDFKEAIIAYRSGESAQQYGNRLRAARLKAALEAGQKPE